ncbi:hypothetical protein CHU00_17590 [Sphingobacterium cellulitidis]|uniref:hypothetical protein n=1 Tax=Sphingobacterium cellulitidis TaxID=1768011 RepID=UPI000B93C283|nr:hypothetical protein [Sphingobacterium cellulitidis]OYD44322.1 hypothetical protein CHU00_17590 [Sphingobacterium cellulitidis]
MNKNQLLKEAGYSQEFIKSLETYNNSLNHGYNFYDKKNVFEKVDNISIDLTNQSFTVLSNTEVKKEVALNK